MTRTEEFLTAAGQAGTIALNSEPGQILVESLLSGKLSADPHLSPDDWQKTKQDFLLFVFSQLIQEDSTLREEFGKRLYLDLREGQA